MMRTQMPLLDAMAVQMKCEYLSDLRLLSSEQRRFLAAELGRVPAEKVPLSEWNDAVEYLTNDRGACSDPAQAKAALIAALSAGRK